MPQFGSMRFCHWLAVLALIGGAGCKESKPFIGGKVPKVQYNNVVSLSPGCTELAATTYARRVVGRTASCNAPERIKVAPIIMKGVKPDYEKIAKLKPDVVLYDPDLFSQSDIDKFKELGIPTFAIGGDTVDAYVDNVYEFGRYTNAAELGSDYLDRVVREKETALASAPKPPVSVAVIIPGSNSEHMVAGIDGFTGDVVKSGGGKPVGPPGRLFVNLNAEWLLQANPELIITAGEADSFLKDPRFKNLDAVKKGHVYGTNADVSLRRGAYVDRFVRRVGQLANIVRQGASK